MAVVAEALMFQVMQRAPKLCPLSAVRQQTMHHRKVPYPVGGVLPLDVAGPLVPAKDIGGL